MICEGQWFWEYNLSIINIGDLKLRDHDGLGNVANEDGGEENCMEMSREWDGINDRPCEKRYVALCQKY